VVAGCDCNDLSIARVEQGRSVPTVAKLFELLAAVAPTEDFVLQESRRHLRREPGRTAIAWPRRDRPPW